MAFQANNEQIITFQATVSATTARKTPWFKFPRNGTIKAAYLGTNNGVATANTTTAYAPAIMNGGSVGTSTLTVATWGSVATPYVQTATQGYTATWVPDSTGKDFLEGQWAVFDEELAGTPSGGIVGVVAHVVLGTGRVSSTG